MFKRKIIIIPLSLSLDWSTDYYEQTVKILQNEGNIVIFYKPEPLITISDIWKNKKIPFFFLKNKLGIFQFNAIQLLPFRRFKTIELLNSKINHTIFEIIISLLSTYHSYERILWIFSPHLFKYFVNSKNFKIIYDCVDYRLESDVFENTGSKYEKMLLLKADLVTVISHVLKDKLSPFRKKISVVPQGFRIESYKKRYKKICNEKLIIGYIGGLNWRVDFDLLLFLAQIFPNIDFIIVGKFQKSKITSVDKHVTKKIAELNSYKNIILISNAPKKAIPDLVNTFDIGIIPYTKSIFNLYCYPMKIFEYFYIGIPVISSEILELYRFKKYILIAKDKYDWIKFVKKLSKQIWPKKYKVNQKKIAINNSWIKKLEAISNDFQLHN